MNARISMTLAAAILLPPAVLSVLALAGPLDPPAGPVAPSYKTLAEIEPRTAVNAANTPGDADSVFKITQPGSYYLQAPLVGAAGKHGIEIATSDVTLDLNGFILLGVPTSLDGVGVSGLVNNIVVRNGTVVNWGSDGINLTSSGNVGVAGVVENIIAHANGHIGIRTNFYTAVRGCVARNNGQDGIYSGGTALITDCAASNNSREGYNVGPSGILARSLATSNGRDGVRTDRAAMLDSVASRLNTADGINAAFNSMLLGPVASENQGNGIRVEFNSQVIAAVAERNTLAGLLGESSNLVTDSTFAANTSNGASLGQDSVIMRNNLWGNGAGAGSGAGILLTGTGARVQFNNANDNDRGIETLINVTRNLILANSCTGNSTNWSIAANNFYGSVTNIGALTSPAVVGSGGSPSGLGPSNAFANFTY